MTEQSTTPSSPASGGQCSVYHQYWGAICANLTHLSFGASLGWLLLTSTGLQTHHSSHLGVEPIADVELAWVIGSFLLSGVVGTLFISWMADGFGRKHTLCTLSLAQMGSWGLYMIATNATEMYISGMMAGFAGGGSMVIVLMFVAEIAEDRVRGSLLAFTTLFVHAGQLFAIVPLFFLPSKETSYALAVLPFVFLFAFVYYPDTPFQLRKENQKELALKSLYLYRGARHPAQQYSDYIKKEVIKFNQTVIDVKLQAHNFSTRSAIKTFLIIATLMIAQQCCGCFLSIIYTDRLPFVTLLPTDVMSVVCAVLQVIGSLIAFVLVERAGRKSLLTVSALGVALALGALAICLHIGYNSPPVFTGLVAAIAFCSSFGLLPLPYVLLLDLMPQKIRTMGVTVCLGSAWLLSFALFNLSMSLPTLGFVMLLAYTTAALCVLGAAVVLLAVPKTQGQSNDDIVLEMERR